MMGSVRQSKIQLSFPGKNRPRQLGLPKMLILGLQHMFAMFGATVLVPITTMPPRA